jgi:hypothetical protein
MKLIQFISSFLISQILFSGCDLLIKKEPLVTITQPVDGSTVKGPVIVKVDVDHDTKIEKVRLLVDGEKIGTDNQTPYEFIWQTAFWSTEDVHELKAKAIDSKGISGTSRAVEVKINTKGLNIPVGTQPLYDSVIVDMDSVYLKWTATIGTDKYQVEVSQDSSFESFVFSSETPDTFINVNLSEEGTYYWKVRACDENSRCSRWTEPLRFWIRKNVFYKVLFDSVSYQWGDGILKIIKAQYGEYEIIEKVGSDIIIYDVNENGEIYNTKKLPIYSLFIGGIKIYLTDNGYFMTNGNYYNEGEGKTIIEVNKIGDINTNWSKWFSVKGKATVLKTIKGPKDKTAFIVGNTQLKNNNFAIFFAMVDNGLYNYGVKYLYGDSLSFVVRKAIVLDLNNIFLYGYFRDASRNISLISLNLDGTIKWELGSFEGLSYYYSWIKELNHKLIVYQKRTSPGKFYFVSFGGQILNEFEPNTPVGIQIRNLVGLENGLVLIGRSSHYGNGITVLQKMDYSGNVIWSKEYDDPYELRSGNLGFYDSENGFVSFTYGGTRHNRMNTVARANSDGYFEIQPWRSYP